MTHDDRSTHSSVQIERIDGEAVLYEPATATLHHLNPTALAIWELASTGMPIDDIVASLAETHGVGPEAIADDVARLVDDLGARGLLGGPGTVDHDPTDATERGPG